MERKSSVKDVHKYIKQDYPDDWKIRYVDYLYDLCKQVGSNALLLEQMLVHRSQARIRLMDSLLSDISKNTIVFAHHTEYLK